MKPKRISFDFNRDFLRVRDFLAQTFFHYGHAVNWRIERWEYAFGFVAPFLANWGEDPPSQESIDNMMQQLIERTGLWETDAGQIAGVVSSEHADPTHPAFAEFFIQRHPQHLDLLPEMLNFVEENLRTPEMTRQFIYADPADNVLVDLLTSRGFRSNSEREANESEFDFGLNQLPNTPNLPEGFRLQSMADENDLAKRCKAFGVAFNHPDPLEWPSMLSYQSLQSMPDYHKDQDIVAVAPDGEYAAFSLIWYDEVNQLACLEPVGCQPEYRRMGLAREAIYEGMRRVVRKGAKRVYVGSDQEFYRAIGFVPAEHRVLYEKSLRI
ncbi:GNAT family N-acetyltransferase [bacterium]|nr:GNAT family N-acetyltransferase [bacterium]